MSYPGLLFPFQPRDGWWPFTPGSRVSGSAGSDKWVSGFEHGVIMVIWIGYLGDGCHPSEAGVCYTSVEHHLPSRQQAFVYTQA